MTNLTEADFAAMKARADAATPGPWDDRSGYILVEDDARIADIFDSSDAEFIAHAREDVPALLSQVAALRKQIDLADKAPHEDECRTRLPANWANRKCDCWRAEYDAAKEATK